MHNDNGFFPMSCDTRIHLSLAKTTPTSAVLSNVCW